MKKFEEEKQNNTVVEEKEEFKIEEQILTTQLIEIVPETSRWRRRFLRYSNGKSTITNWVDKVVGNMVTKTIMKLSRQRQKYGNGRAHLSGWVAYESKTFDTNKRF